MATRKKAYRPSGSISKRFLRPEQIEEAISEVALLAKEQHVEVALVGGIAMQLYGSDRFTKDVDVAADGLLDGLEESGVLSFGGVVARTSAGTEVDVILRNDSYADLYEDALVAPRRLRGVPLPVVSREHLAAMKFAAHRGKDLDDLAFLILETPLNIPRARKIIETHLGRYALNEYQVFVDETRVLGRRR